VSVAIPFARPRQNLRGPRLERASDDVGFMVLFGKHILTESFTASDPKRKCRVNQLGPPVMPRPRPSSRRGASSRRRVVHCVGVPTQPAPAHSEAEFRSTPTCRWSDSRMAGHKLSLRTGLNLAQRLRRAKEVAAEPTTKPMSNAGYRINRVIPPPAWSRPVAAEFAAYAAAGRDDIGKASHRSLLSWPSRNPQAARRVSSANCTARTRYRGTHGVLAATVDGRGS